MEEKIYGNTISQNVWQVYCTSISLNISWSKEIHQQPDLVFAYDNLEVENITLPEKSNNVVHKMKYILSKEQTKEKVSSH